MRRTMLLSIAGLAALAGTAIGQTREAEPAWRASALGANYANGGTRMGGLFLAPFADAK